MITREQIEALSEYYQIDSFTIFREYLQLIFLNYLYQNKKADRIYFKGGTSVHLLFNSPRFSEDLDFSTVYKKEKIKKIIQEIKNEITREIAEVTISLLYQGKKSVRFRLTYAHSDFKYPFVIRIDFNEDKKPEKAMTSPLVTRFPLIFFPLIVHLSAEEILAEKFRAFLLRAKGRDIYDLWFLLEKGIEVKSGLINKKMRQVGRKFEINKLIKKVKISSRKKLERDLSKFLPQSQRAIIRVLAGKLASKLEASVAK